MKLDHKVSLNVQKKPLREVLNLLFANKPISYKITGKHILLQKTPPKPVSRKFTVSGYVTDGASAETLIGANILESRHHQGTTTNPYGFYSITLPEGEARLSFSYLGYTGQQHVLNLTADTLLNIRMKDNNMLQEVVIVSDKAESGVMATQMGASEIPMTQIKKHTQHPGRSRCDESHPADAGRTSRNGRLCRTLCTRRRPRPEPDPSGRSTGIQRRPFIGLLLRLYT